MIVATLIGDPTWAVVAAVLVPLAFVLLIYLLAKDPGPRRNVSEGHPAYVRGRDDEDGEA